MDKNEHLTTDQLLAYSTGASKGKEKREAGRHLLTCDECLKQAPPPTAQMVWQAVMGKRKMPKSIGG